MSLKKKLRDLALYVLIAACVFTPLVLLAILHVALNRTWFILAVATVFLCVFVPKMYWNHRKSAKLWILLGALLIAHIVGFSILLERLPQFPDVLLLAAVPLEAMLVAAVVKISLDIMPQRVKL
ncbi:MAG: hypothetical protein ACRD8A_06095 [Candidatus Acidiferrales bacterium]